MEDDLQKDEWMKTSEKNGRRPPKKLKTTSKKWKMNQSTKINLIGCDTIVNSPSSIDHFKNWSCDFNTDNHHHHQYTSLVKARQLYYYFNFSGFSTLVDQTEEQNTLNFMCKSLAAIISHVHYHNHTSVKT
jgi:hypothetical protein